MSEIHVILCGTLRVKAEEMIRPVSVDWFREKYPVAEDGTIRLAMNALLIKHDQQVILIDPGSSDFLPRRLAIAYGLEKEGRLEDRLAEQGIMPEDITDVIFTHLHFDHGSGAFQRKPGKIVKRFPRARYQVLKEHYAYALQPESTEADAFFTRFFRYIDPPHWLEEWQEEWMTFKVFNGHTRGMVVPFIHLNGNTTCYLSDLIPMALFLENEIYSGYDLDPKTALLEKQEFLKEVNNSLEFIFFHDILNDRMIYP